MNTVKMKWSVKSNATGKLVMDGSLGLYDLDTDELGEVAAYSLGVRGKLSEGGAQSDYTLNLAADADDGKLTHDKDYQIDDNKMSQILRHMTNGTIKLIDFKEAHKKQKAGGKP